MHLSVLISEFNLQIQNIETTTRTDKGALNLHINYSKPFIFLAATIGQSFMTIKLKRTLRNHSVTIHLIAFPLNLISLPSSAMSLVRSCWFNSIVEFIPFLGLACH